ncbi:hypothetical protein HaLaN_05441 [Haematococcus lacustris]|uniref:Uncharacterized protein n=1 Tax=Haematococcus lacustris TaxID=44745 RepID=A0A699YTR1_HAELA|nr:hypothetical protein HaLaN_05441 [Haematococcus lacustris]
MRLKCYAHHHTRRSCEDTTTRRANARLIASKAAHSWLTWPSRVKGGASRTRVCVFAAVSGLTALFVFLLQQPGLTSSVRLVREPVELACVSWRSTDWCHPHGRRVPAWDADCSAKAPEGGMTTALVECGVHDFTCEEKCKQLTADSSLGEQSD